MDKIPNNKEPNDLIDKRPNRQRTLWASDLITKALFDKIPHKVCYLKS